MKQTPPAIMLADLLTSMSDPSRLRMLRLLAIEELSVGEIAKVFQLPQSSASRQLKILADAFWLTKRSEGTTTLYRLDVSELPDAQAELWQALTTHMHGCVDHDEDDRRLDAVLRDRRTDSVNYFGRVRGEWDQIRTDLFGERFTASALLSLIPHDWVVADIGCGTGNVAESLSPVVEQVIAVDQSAPMLSAAKERMHSRKNVKFVESAVGSLAIESASVDAAVCMLVLHHLADVNGAITDLLRVLRTDRGGGVVMIVDMVEHHRDEYRRTMGHLHQGFSKKQIFGHMTKAGFTHLHYHELAPEPHAKGPGLFVATGRKEPSA